MPFAFKLKYESVVVVVAVSFPFKEVEIKGEEEANNPEDGNDKGKSRIVADRLANERRMESFSRSQDQWKQPHPREKWKDDSNVVGSQGWWSRIREARGKRAAEKA